MRRRVGMTAFPSSPGVYVVYKNKGDRRPLYVGVAERQSLLQRWQRNHLGLVKRELRRPRRYYPAKIEAKITRFLESCWVELHLTKTGREALELERRLIRRLSPRLNVARPR